MFVFHTITLFYASLSFSTKRYNCIGLRKIHKSVFGFSIGDVTDRSLTAEQCREQLSGRPIEFLFMGRFMEWTETYFCYVY